MSGATQKDQVVASAIESPPLQRQEVLAEPVSRGFPATPQPPVRRVPRLAVWLILIAALGSIGAGWYFFGVSSALPVGLLQANGRIESDVVNVSSKLAGRIVTLGAREGDTVKAGAALIQLDDRSVTAQLQQAQSALATASARVESARVSLAVMIKEVPVSIASAEASLAAAEAAERRAADAEAQYGREAERARRLLADGTVPQQTAEQAELAWTSSRNQHAAAAANRAQAEQALADARLGPDRVRAKQAELLSLEATRNEAAARVSQAQTAVDDLRVLSPIDAIVTSRFANIGEVVNAGMPLLELVDPDRLYLKVYIPEKDIGRVRRGLPARIYTDSFPGEPFEATVGYIGSRAEFTPKEVQTPDERTKLVYEVRLYLNENPDHKLTPGMPADAIIRWKEDVAWMPPRW
jgi:HlyD family secretion protein